MTVQNERERLEVAIVDIIKSYLAGHVNTVMPGQIVSFNRSEGTATIQPCFQRVYADRDDPETLPPIEDVPVFFFGSGNRWLTVDLEEDSYVILLFAQRALATWFEQGGIVDPAQSRKFALSDAIALAGLKPATDSIDIEPDSIELRNEEGLSYVRINADDNVEIQAQRPESTAARILVQREPQHRVILNDGSTSVAKVGSTVLSTSTDDSVFWAWVSAVTTATGVPSPPVTLTAKITDGSDTVKVP